MNTLSSAQKEQIRHAFTVVDGESRDLLITRPDVENLVATLGLDDSMVDKLMLLYPSGVNFAHFLATLAKDLARLPAVSVLRHALEEFKTVSLLETDLEVDLDILKNETCLAQLGDIGLGDSRLLRALFDMIVQGFTAERSDGSRVFLAQRWLDIYGE